MMLPILVVGVMLVLLLVAIQAFVSNAAGSDLFAGTSGGAHPIVLDIANGGWQVRVLLVVLAAVAAPIVEETMFRGVLYRQLRTSSNKLGIVLSIICSMLLTSFLFAAIHPQGWIAIPALMAIAIGMNFMREWRGTILPSIIVHGVSNGLVTSMMIIFLS
jgi:membrane protease YdiL (CAAX protease family)